MRLPRSITVKLLILLALMVLGLDDLCEARTLAVLSPEEKTISVNYASDLSVTLSKHAQVLDPSLSFAAFKAVKPADPFNMTIAEALNAGSAIGCDLIVIVKADTLRRASFARIENYESYAAVYVISSRTGRLIFWKLESVEDGSRSDAEVRLRQTSESMSQAILGSIEKLATPSLDHANTPPIEVLPDDIASEGKGFRPPIPYRRVKPEYTAIAALYEVAATVEVQLDLASDGKILSTEIVRWAGFGLDQSVLDTVRSMNWRPAERNGKPIAMRVLLRYNFKKIEE